MAQKTLPRDDSAEAFFAGPGAAAGWFGIFYGWYTVLITALTTMLVVGSTNYAFALFVRPVSADLDLPRATVNSGLVLFYAGTALFGPFVGRILDRYPIRAVALIGAALFGAGMALIGVTSSVWLIAACIFLPVSIGALGCGGLFGAVVVARWFERRRGRALSISAMGTSFGGLVVFPVVAVLVDRLGWRPALLVTGAGVWLLVAALAVFLRPLPRPETGGPGRADRRRDLAWPLGAVLRSIEFWIIALAISLMLAVDGALLVTLTPYVQDRGFSLGQVAALTTTMTASAIAGKIVIAWVADKADLRVLTAITAALGIVQCGVLLLTPSFALLIGADCLAGLAVGGTYPLFSAIVAERFGTASYGWVRGLMSPMISLFGAGAVYFAGAVYDAEHSYRIAFLVFLTCAAAAMVLILTLKKMQPPTGRAMPVAVSAT
jgi:MFS family permease